MTKSLVSAMVLAALAGTANAQSIDFRIIERNGQSAVNQGGDAILDFAVQAKVTSTNGSFLGGFGFNVVGTGEADTNGTLRHGLTSDGAGAYSAVIAAAGSTSPTVGVHGLPKSYTYLAAINAAFDGVINASSGTFTNTAGNQEIGLITGSSLGTQLLGTPGMDPAFDGNPISYNPYGVGDIPAAGATAPMDPAIGATYFAMGAYTDVFRFRYTVTNFSTRALVFTLQGLSAQIASQFVYSNAAWGLNTTTFANSTIAPITISITPAPASAALLGLGGLVAARRRRTA